MENNSKTQNSVKNIFVSISYQFIVVILAFVSRKIFIKTLGIELLGLNGLFVNLLDVFSLAELGIGNAIIYSMYSAINKDDTKKLNALTNYYKKFYTFIAFIIFIIGISLIPFLKYIINLDTEIPQMNLYYFLFLINSVLSYFFVYRTSIVIAIQKEYKLKLITMSFYICRIIMQVLVLILTRNYVLYLITQILFIFGENLTKSYYSQKWYPFIKGKNELEENEKKEIWQNIKSLFCYKIGGVILNNTDNILISIIVGTVMVGIYSNYSLIILQVATFTGLIFTSIQSSVGSLNASSDEEQKYFIFKVLDFIAFWVYGFCSICLGVLLNDFIKSFFGVEYLLGTEIVIISVINYYLQGVLYPIWCFRHTTALFKYTKYTMLFASVINICLSIILGIKYGLFGILVATAISRLLTTIWYEPYVLFKKFFNKSCCTYFKNQIERILLLIITFFITNLIANSLNFSNGILNFIFEIFICLIVVNVVFLILFRKTEEFKYIYDKIKEIVLKLKQDKKI